MFKPISDNIALSQKIVANVTDAIIQGSLRPGDKLPTERDMATQFQVSRTAIRDAIKILSGRGVLDVKHGVGIFVANPDTTAMDEVGEFIGKSDNLRDLFEIRRALETHACRAAAMRAEAEDVTRLQGIIDEAFAHLDDLNVLSQLDAKFHVAIAEASKNLLLVKVMWSLLGSLENGRRSSLLIPSRAQKSVEEHRLILEAISGRQADSAFAAMMNHLLSVEESVQFTQF